MLFEDKFGRLFVSDEIDELSAWEVEELGIFISDAIEEANSRELEELGIFIPIIEQNQQDLFNDFKNHGLIKS